MCTKTIYTCTICGRSVTHLLALCAAAEANDCIAYKLGVTTREGKVVKITCGAECTREYWRRERGEGKEEA